MAENRDTIWENIFQARETPQWTKEDEMRLQGAVQGGDVPPQVLQRYAPTLPSTTPVPSVPQIAPSRGVSAGEIKALVPVGAETIKARNLAGVTPPPQPPQRGKDGFPFLEDPRPLLNFGIPPPFVAAPQAKPDNPADIPKWLIDYYGPQVLSYLPAVITTLATKNMPPLVRAFSIGSSAGVPQFFRETVLETPAPGTPEAQGNYWPAAQRGLRTTLTVGGATLGSQLSGPTQEGARLMQRLGRGAEGAFLTGAGASAGSAAAEPFAPSGAPWRTAVTTGEQMALWDASFRAGAGIVGAFAGPSKFVTPTGAEAGRTLMEEGIPVPSTATNSLLSRAVEMVGGSAIGAGSFLRRSRTRGEAKLTGRLEETSATGALPTDVNVRTALDAHGYQPGFTDAAKASQAQARQGLYNDLDTLMKDRVYATGRPVQLGDNVTTLATEIAPNIPMGTPASIAINAFANNRSLTLQNTERLLQTLDTYSQSAGLTQNLKGNLDTLVVRLRGTIDNPTVLNMGGLKRPIEQLRQDISGIEGSADLVKLLDTAGEAQGMMSLRDARNLRSRLLAEARALETGGAMRAPTPTGQAPSPGTGKEMAERIQRQAGTLSTTIEKIIEAETKPFGADVYSTYRIAQEAAKVGVKQNWLEEFFGGSDVYNNADRVYKGQAILDKLKNIEGSGEKLANVIGQDTADNIKKFALALTKLQDASDTSSTSMFHHLLRFGVRSLQIGGSFVAASHGSPELALVSALTPEAMGFIMNNPGVSNMLVMGMRDKIGLAQATQALGRVAGALHTAGLLAATPAPDEKLQATQGPPTATQARQSELLANYNATLASAPMAQAQQYWNEYLSQQPDADAKQAFQQAFQSRFGRPAGGGAIPAAP